MNLMNGGRRFPTHHLLYFAGVNLDAFTGDSVTQKFDCVQLEFTLGEFRKQLMISEALKNNTQMLFMFYLVLGIDQNVIDENHDKLVKFRHEYRVHEIHEISGSICETERHNQIFIETISG